ncbi:unnamed protein product, partial [Ectocarpus fasciculatus]
MLRIRNAADFCGVHPNTLRKWDVQSSITKGKHRLYSKQELCRVMHRKYVKPGEQYDLGKDTDGTEIEREKYIYCRVSSNSQKDDLKRQIQCMSEQYPGFSVLSDIASGINFKRRSLQSLLERVICGTVEKIVVSHRDRLARFGFELIELICKSNGCELLVHNEVDVTPGERVVQDVLNILHVYNCRIQGSRKYKSKKKEDLKGKDRGGEGED